MICGGTRAALCAIGVMVGLALPAGASAALPDLVSDKPENVTMDEQIIGGSQRLLLRFDAFVFNAGPGRLQFDASGRVGDAMTDIKQVVTDENGVEVPEDTPAEIIWEDSSSVNMDGHDHFHLQRAARYSLWLGDRSAEVAPGSKVGFCLLDGERVDPSASPTGAHSDCGEPGRDWLEMGLSPGWRDEYVWQTPFQWVDVTDVASGRYWLQTDVDPDDVIREANESNAPDGIDVVLPGHTARPATLAVGAREVTLPSEAVPVPGQTAEDLRPPEFRVIELPKHGTLSVTAGDDDWFGSPSITYTPDVLDDPTPDSFRFVAREQGRRYPRNPPAMTVTLAGGPAAAINGAPEAMIAGTSVQLQTVDGATWSADTGVVSPAGVYTAPATTGTARVRVLAPNGTSAEITIRILPVPRPEPAPVPMAAPAGDSVVAPPSPVQREAAPLAALPRRHIEAAVAQHVGRWVAVTTKPGRSGSLRVVLRRGSHTVASCASRVRAGQTSTCRLTRPRRGRGPVRVVVVLKADRGGTVTRSVAIRSGHVH